MARNARRRRKRAPTLASAPSHRLSGRSGRPGGSAVSVVRRAPEVGRGQSEKERTEPRGAEPGPEPGKGGAQERGGAGAARGGARAQGKDGAGVPTR